MMVRFLRKLARHESVEIDDAVLTASERDVAQMEFRLNKRWLTAVVVVMLSILIGLCVRVGYLSIVRGDFYRNRANINSTRYTVVPAPRGLILDRFGVPLVENVPQTDVVLTPSLLPEDAIARHATIRKLARIFNLQEKNLQMMISNTLQHYGQDVLIATNISQDERFSFIENADNLRSAHLVTTARRNYIDSILFSHILGYTGIVQAEDLAKDDSYYLTDEVGRTGVEKVYESLLRGTHGAIGVEIDAHGNAQRMTQDTAPIAGNDLYLAIDAELQKSIITIMKKAFSRFGITRGAVVALDPRDGSIRALVSMPAYDNNAFVGGIEQDQYRLLVQDPDKPLFNRAIAGAYPPGSTVKPILAGAALSEGVIDENTTVNSTGAIRIGAYTFRDWRVNGVADVRRAIAVSHDIFFYAVGGGYGAIKGMGIDTMKRYYNRFGFGEKTGIDLPGEARGFIPDRAWKEAHFGQKWSIGNDYHAAIGQGFITATPLQIANATAAIANGGTLWQPHVLAYWRDHNGVLTSYKPQKKRTDILSREIIRIVQEGMRMTVTEGTAQLFKHLPVKVAAKTGTAQFGTQKKTHSWMTSFAPYDNPEIVILVLMEGQNEHTSSASAPVALEIYKWYFTQRFAKNSEKLNS